MALNPSNFKAYDIRGVYPTDLDEEGMDKIARGIYTFYAHHMSKQPLKVVLSRDMRVSSPSLHNAAKKALLALGAQVLDIGLASTPTAYFAVRHLKGDICMHITASHNPKQYNGMKFVKRLDDTVEKPSGSYSVADIKKTVLSGDFIPETNDGVLIDVPNIIESEVNYFFNMMPVHPDRIYKIVADVANAMGATYLDQLAKKVDIDLVRMNFELDGTFPSHPANPSQYATLKDLRKKVVDEKADFGIATDGDGDRIVFIDEKGEIVPTSLMASLIARELLKEHPGAVIIGNVIKIFNIKRNVERFGGIFDQIRVGHTFITNRINHEDIDFCGEISGHYYFKKNGGAESSVLVFLYIIKALNEYRKPLSEILHEFKQAEEREETNFVVPDQDAVFKILADLEERNKQHVIEKIDGVTVLTPEWRLNVRTSNTEPLLRLNVEANNLDLLNEKFDETKSLIESHGGKLAVEH